MINTLGTFKLIIVFILNDCKTYFPIAESRKLIGSESLERKVKETFEQDGCKDRLSIACSKPCGAISITIAFSGICLQPSSNSTGLTKLFVKYSAEHHFAKTLSHLSSETEVLIHFVERSFGSLII